MLRSVLQTHLHTIIEWFEEQIEIKVHEPSPPLPDSVLTMNLYGEQQQPESEYPLIFVHSPSLPCQTISIGIAAQ
jgi:hypothetical protein